MDTAVVADGRQHVTTRTITGNILVAGGIPINGKAYSTDQRLRSECGLQERELVNAY